MHVECINGRSDVLTESELLLLLRNGHRGCCGAFYLEHDVAGPLILNHLDNDLALRPLF